MNESENLCPGCFANNSQVNPCPHCNYDEHEPRGLLMLPHRSILQEQFVVGKILGKPGGFGITYLGWDQQLEMRVAIKEYLPRDLAGREAGNTTIVPHARNERELFRYGLEQFLAEARILARLDHPNIVRVRQFFEANGTAYLVMDYYEGLSLEEYLERQGGRVSEETAKQLTLPILDGLREVHARGFLHRDIKPQNIYLAKLDGKSIRPILLDFGAARQAMGERNRSLSILLTAGYAPYEQYYRSGQQGTWTDVYAIGATLYQMVTGATPPEATERRDKDQLQPATAYGVSPALSTILTNALSVLPEQRTQTIELLQEQLLESDTHNYNNGIFTDKNVLDSKDTPENTANTTPWIMQQFRLGVVLLILLTAGLAFGGWYLYQKMEESEQRYQKNQDDQIKRSNELWSKISEARSQQQQQERYDAEAKRQHEEELKRQHDLEEAARKQHEEELKRQHDLEEANKEHPEEPSPNASKQSDDSGTKEQACSVMYSLFKRCYEAGDGASVDTCANLSSSIIAQMRDKMGPLATPVGLLCGLACSEGIAKQGLPDYSSFQKQHCQDQTEPHTEPEPHVQISPIELEKTTALAPAAIMVGDSYVYASILQGRPEANSMIRRTVDDINGNTITFSSLDLGKRRAKKRKLYFDREWNLIKVVNADGVLKYSPPLKYYDFPLYPGKSWHQITTETNTKTGATKTHTISGTTGMWEDITVPAGTFHAIKVSLDIAISDPSTGTTKPSTDVSWYVPEVHRSVKTIISSENGEEKEIQLTSYSLISR